MRQKLSLVLYLAFVELLILFLVVIPAYPFQISSSTTGFVRTASQTAMSTMMGAQRSAILSSIAPAISVSTAGSLALRLVAASVGWPALGIVAGMTLAMVYYDQTKIASIKQGAAPVFSGFTWPLYTGSGTVTGVYMLGDIPIVTLGPVQGDLCAGVWQNMPVGWSGGNYLGECAMQGPANSPSDQLPQSIPASATTPIQIAEYLNQLPPSDPNSIESNTIPVGAQAIPTPSDATVSHPVPATGLETTVVPATQVQPTDTVINPNATAPAGPVPTQTATQTSTSTNTTTTTTITNPDGSTTTSSTKTETEEAPVSACSTGYHEQRTFGGILQDHMDLWKGSGLLTALTLLKTLTWPTAMPTYSLQSNLLGTFTLDFSAWSDMLTAIRSIIIAIAGFVAYRMIFVGAR